MTRLKTLDNKTVNPGTLLLGAIIGVTVVLAIFTAIAWFVLEAVGGIDVSFREALAVGIGAILLRLRASGS